MSYIEPTEDTRLQTKKLSNMIALLLSISFGSLLLQLYNSAYLPSNKEIILVPNGLKENVELGKGKYSEHYLKELTKSFTNLFVSKDYSDIEKNNTKLLNIIDRDMQEYILFKLKREVREYADDKKCSKLLKISEINVDKNLLKGKAHGIRTIYIKGVPVREEKIRVVVDFKDIGNLLLVEDFNVYTEEMKILKN